MLAPAFILPSMSVSSLITLTITGISKASAKLFTVSFGVGALTIKPIAPCISALVPSITERRPLVSPPPTPVKTGISAAKSKDCVMIG